MIEYTIIGIIAVALEVKHGDADFSPMGFIACGLAFIGAPAVFSNYYNALILKNRLTKTEKWGLTGTFCLFEYTCVIHEGMLETAVFLIFVLAILTYRCKFERDNMIQLKNKEIKK